MHILWGVIFCGALTRIVTKTSHIQVVERVSKELIDGDHGMAVHLDSEDGWSYWKEKMSAMKEVGNYEFALFMYCKLNQ